MLRLILAIAIAFPAAAQQAAFEVASVKPNHSGDLHGGLHREPGGRVTATNVTLSTLIGFAWQAQSFAIINAPNWIGNERYDIVAKLDGDTTGDERLRLAMRALLEDRFRLKVHHETREVDIYALVAARPGAGHSAGLRTSAEDCGPARTPQMLCGMRFGPNGITFGGLPLKNFTDGIAGLLGRPVIDRTSLAGNWDFELTFSPDQTDTTVPSVFTAVQEQLGLRLQSAKGPAEVLVIDNVARPSAD